MKINWNFLGERRDAKQKPSMGGVWIFSPTAHCWFVGQCLNEMKFHSCGDCPTPFIQVA